MHCRTLNSNDASYFTGFGFVDPLLAIPIAPLTTSARVWDATIIVAHPPLAAMLTDAE